MNSLRFLYQDQHTLDLSEPRKGNQKATKQPSSRVLGDRVGLRDDGSGSSSVEIYLNFQFQVQKDLPRQRVESS